MIYKPYDLSFLFDPIGSATGFLIPVFLEQGSVDKFAVQIIGRDGIVSSFSRVELEDAADLISTKNRRTLYIGDSALYAFRCHLEEITVGNKTQVSSYLEENLSKFKKRSYLLHNVAEFIGDHELQLQQRNLIRQDATW